MDSSVGDHVRIDGQGRTICSVVNLRTDELDWIPWGAFVDAFIGVECRCEIDCCFCVSSNKGEYLVGIHLVVLSIKLIAHVEMENRPPRKVCSSGSRKN